MSKPSLPSSDESLLAFCLEIPPDLVPFALYFTLRQFRARDRARCALVERELSKAAARVKAGVDTTAMWRLARAARTLRAESWVEAALPLILAYSRVKSWLEETSRQDWNSCLKEILDHQDIKQPVPNNGARTKLRADLHRNASAERIALDILAAAGWGTGPNAADNIRTTLKRHWRRLGVGPSGRLALLPSK